MSLRPGAIAAFSIIAGWLTYAPAMASPDLQDVIEADTVPEIAITHGLEDEASILHVGAAEVVRQLTGLDSVNATGRWNIHGTDLGHMVLHKDALYMVFGDTYGPDGDDWRSSAMARLADPDPRGAFEFATMIEAADGSAKELIRSAKIPGIEWTVIPTNGISLGERMVLHYMSVRMWTSDGRWLVRQSGLAYSDDDGQTWQRSPTAIWPANTEFEQVAFVEDDGLIYSFGIPQGRFGAVRLRRVAPESMFDPAAHSYWDGNGWVADHRLAAPVVPAPAGELSVAWSAAHQRWMMMYLDEVSAAIVLRTAPNLVGPWSDARTVALAGDFPGLYAPYIVPGSDIDDALHFTMSRWKPLYNVFLMRAQLTIGIPDIAAVTD